MWHILKTLIASLWILIVVAIYYGHQVHYQNILPKLPGYAWAFLIIFLVYLTLLLYLYKTKQRLYFTLRLSPFKVFLFFLLFFWVTFNILVSTQDLSLYEGPTIVLEEGRFYVPQAGEKIKETSQIFAQKGQVLSATTRVKTAFKPEIHKYFVKNSFWNVQKTFFLKFGAIFLFLIVILTLIHSFGRVILKRLPPIYRNLKTPREKFVFASALGLAGLMLILFLLGVFGYLTPFPVWTILILILILSYRHILPTLKIYFHSHELKIKLVSWTFWGFLILNLLFVANFINLSIPVPIGWDSLHLYINLPHLISDGGQLISGLSAYYYGIFLSLGFILFNSATMSMALILLAAILVLIAFYTFLRKFFKRNLSILLLTLFFSLPTVFFQTSIDAKTDLALVFFGIVSLLALLKALPLNLKAAALLKPSDSPRRNIFREKISSISRLSGFTAFLYLAAFLLGITFGIKYTAIFAILVFILILGKIYFGKFGFLALFFLEWAAIIHFNYLALGNDTLSPAILLYLKIILGILGLVSLIFVFIRQVPAIFKSLRQFILICLVITIGFSPWLIYNYSTTHSLSISKLLYGKPQSISIDYEKLDIDPSSECHFTGNKEDMDRFFGYNARWSGLFKFLILPWILTMSAGGVKGFFVDFSFIFLAFIPVFLFFYRPQSWRKKRFKILSTWTIFYWSFWWFMGNGIIWYGLMGFAGLIGILGRLYLDARRTSILCRYLWTGLLIGWFLLLIPVRFDLANINTILAYESGLISSDQFTQSHFPFKAIVEKQIEQEPLTENEYFYDAGTFLTYFIPENHRRVYGDMTLDTFNCFYHDKDGPKTVERLRASGFKYIIVNTKLTTLTETPEGELEQKFKNFVEFSAANLVFLGQDRKHAFYKLPDYPLSE